MYEYEKHLDELNKYCWNSPLCEKNGRRCVFYEYCETHEDFDTKNVEMLYERMKERMEEDKRNDNKNL